MKGKGLYIMFFVVVLFVVAVIVTAEYLTPVAPTLSPYFIFQTARAETSVPPATLPPSVFITVTPGGPTPSSLEQNYVLVTTTPTVGYFAMQTSIAETPAPVVVTETLVYTVNHTSSMTYWVEGTPHTTEESQVYTYTQVVTVTPDWSPYVTPKSHIPKMLASGLDVNVPLTATAVYYPK